jgi:hypothetical protein
VNNKLEYQYNTNHDHPYFDQLDSFINIAIRFNSQIMNQVFMEIVNSLQSNFTLKGFESLCFSIGCAGKNIQNHYIPFEDSNETGMFFNFLFQFENFSNEHSFILSFIYLIT